MKQRKILFLVLITILLLGLIGFWKLYLQDKNSNGPQEKKTTSVVKPRNTVDHSPSTSEDNTTSEQRKNNPKSATSNLNNESVPNTSASITITEANPSGSQSIRVSSIVNGVASGTCNYSFSKSENGPAEHKAVSTIALSGGNQYYACTPQSVTMSSKGAWYVSVTVGENGSVKNIWPNNPVRL